VASPDETYPVRCPNAQKRDDTDHVMARVIDPARLRFPQGHDANPFIQYRELFYSYHVGRAHGLTDSAYIDLVADLDRAVARVDGHEFTITPFKRSRALSGRFGSTGGVWVKNETGNVSGSHKGRHLMGLLIHLEVVERVGLARGGPTAPDLAIASCGNAALAAAVVARAGDRRLLVFVPTTADQAIVRRLEQLDAKITVCPRNPAIPGDPTYHGLQEAVRGGAFPFTCQGPDNGLTIEGGKTLGYEMVSALGQERQRLDRLIIQVGGGALASSCIQALQDATQLGALEVMPRLHSVQTRGAYPLKRAYDRLRQRILGRLERERGARPIAPSGDRERADLIKEYGSSPLVDEELRFAATHRSQFMWAWEEEPKSIAHGILDDETYDWFAVVKGMVTTGGYPIVVSEQTLVEANRAGREATDIDVDPTGSAGLAGLMQLDREGGVRPDETVAVLFTGIRR
jgi:threonine synthase